MGPVLLQDAGAVIVNFHLPFHFKPDTFRRQIESADPSEQGSDRQFSACFYHLTKPKRFGNILT